MREVERKFRIVALPRKHICGRGVPIVQGYLFTEQGELRIRREGEHYELTVKDEGGLSRAEWKVEIPGWVFDTLWPGTEGRRVEKIRYLIRDRGNTLELDEYLGRHRGLLIMECEFPDEQAANAFTLPAWAADAVEVTGDARYKNKALAVNGLPSEARKRQRKAQ